MLEKLKNNWLIVSILIIAFLLRFVPLFEYEFFFDELSSLARIQYDSVGDIIDKGVKVDVHPALIQLFIFYWAKIGGTSEVWIKWPFLLCGFLSCWFTFKFAKKWFDYKTGVISSLVVSCSMIFLVYSANTHLYATGILFGLLATMHLFEIVFGNSVKIKDYVLFGIFILLGALNHHMGALYGAIIGVLALVFAEKKQKMYLIGAGLGTAALYFPHLSITLAQMGSSISADSGGWLVAPKWDACFQFLKTLFGTGIVIFAFIFLFVYGGTESKFSFKSDKKLIFLFSAFVIYCAVVYFYSVYKSPILQNSVLLIASPCILIVVARAISFIPEKIFTITAVSLTVALLVQTIYVKEYFKLGVKNGVGSAVKETMDCIDKYGYDNVVSVYNTEPFFGQHYITEFKQKFSFISAFDSVYTKPALFGNYLRGLKEQYIVLQDPDAIHLEQAKVYFPFVIKRDEGYFKSIYVLSKKGDKAINDETVVNTFNLANKGGFVFPDNYKREGNDVLVDSLDEFPFYVWGNLDAGIVQYGQWVVCSATYIPQKPTENLSFDFGVKQKDSLIFYSSRNFKDFYLQGDSVQYGFSSIFMGTDFRDWLNQKDKLECYFWNQSKRRYIIKSLDLKILDINPHKYSVWD